MKTRQEMIYDFMLALASTTTDKSKDMLKFYDTNHKELPDDFEEILCNSIYHEAACLADAYLENL
jgi:hypothetical protein